MTAVGTSIRRLPADTGRSCAELDLPLGDIQRVRYHAGKSAPRMIRVRNLKTHYWLLLLAACALSPFAVVAKTPLCGEILSPDQWKSVLSEKADGDPVLSEAIEHERARNQDDPSPKGIPMLISWTQARTLVLLGTVRTTHQMHDLKVVLVTISGRRFVTAEPKIDEIDKVVAVVDPCHAYVRQLTE